MPELDPTAFSWLDEALNHAIAGFSQNGGLPPWGGARLRELIKKVERYPAGATVQAGTREPRLKWIVAGWAGEMRVLPDSRRQICSFLLPGDLVIARGQDSRSPCTVVALTRLECIDVAQTLGKVRDTGRAQLWEAVSRGLSVNEERKYEHIIRLGQHSAAERLINLILELRDRLSDIGLVAGDRFRLPLTQEHLADALGLSVVHVNRTLRELRAQRLMEVRFGGVTLLHPDKLAALAGRAGA